MTLTKDDRNKMARHRLQVQEYGASGPVSMTHVALMAVLSIRQHWSTVGMQLDSVRAYGKDSRYLFSHKAKAYKYITDNADWLYGVTYSAVETEENLLDAWTTVPGLGLAKAGFVVQLLRGWAGCLDSHNLKRYGYSANDIRLGKKLSARSKLARIRQYQLLVKECGGSAALWDEWCTLLAAKNENMYTNAVCVSARHIGYLTKEWT